jgi:hypothetical protein
MPNGVEGGGPSGPPSIFAAIVFAVFLFVGLCAAVVMLGFVIHLMEVLFAYGWELMAKANS